jgi:hypothetical protein
LFSFFNFSFLDSLSFTFLEQKSNKKLGGLRFPPNPRKRGGGCSKAVQWENQLYCFIKILLMRFNGGRGGKIAISPRPFGYLFRVEKVKKKN